jgi:hypothetical protein
MFLVTFPQIKCLQTSQVAPDVLKEHGKVGGYFAHITLYNNFNTDQEPLPQC